MIRRIINCPPQPTAAICLSGLLVAMPCEAEILVADDFTVSSQPAGYDEAALTTPRTRPAAAT